MLDEVLLDRREQVTGETISAHFERPLRAWLRSLLESKPVTEVLPDAGRQSILDGLKSAAKPVAFSCGLELLAPFHLDIESPGYQQERLREVQRGLTERQAAGQVEHFQRAAELLKQFQSLRASTPELSASQVLQQMSPADRGSALQTLLLASSQKERAADLWAVAGPYLVKIDVHVSPPATHLFPLPPTLGPLRSIQPANIQGESVLLVGAVPGSCVCVPVRHPRRSCMSIRRSVLRSASAG